MATSDERPRSALARGRLWLWVRRVLVALVGLIVLLLLLGVLYQFLAVSTTRGSRDPGSRHLRDQEVREERGHGLGGVLLGEVGATGYRPQLRARYGFVQLFALL